MRYELEHAGYWPTEPGSSAARARGCTCPAQRPRQLADGGVVYVRDEDCPLHPSEAQPDERRFAQARAMEDYRARERQASDV